MRWLTRFGAPLAAVWLLTACGEESLPAQDESVLALDLQSGERRRFKARKEVPSRWTICADDACTIPPSVPCEQLGLRLCVDRPECKPGLFCELDFESGPLAVREAFLLTKNDRPSSRSGSAGESVACKMTCTTREPSSCEAATDEQTCLGLSSVRCEWAPVGPCWLRERTCAPGTGCMPSPDCKMACRPATPPPADRCEKNGDEGRRQADPACEWIRGPVSCNACAAVTPGCDCSPPPPD